MSINYTTGKKGRGCTRELFLKKEFADPTEKLLGMALVCYELLRLAAEEYFGKARMGSYDKAAEHDSFIADVEACLYDFLLTCLVQETQDSPSKTLGRALASPADLIAAWTQYKKNKISGNKRAEDAGNMDEVFRQRWHYYRDRLRRVLIDRKVAVREMGSWEELLFSYGSYDLPTLSMDRFREQLNEFSSDFAPSLKDEDFWRGEEPVYHMDGTVGRREGPGGEALDQFCREFWLHAAKFFGGEHVLMLSMVLRALPNLYTYFAKPGEIFLDADPEEDQGGMEIPPLELPDKTPIFDEREMTAQELEANREAIVAKARTISPRDRKLMLMQKACLPDVEKARRLGLSSSSRIREQTANAFRIFEQAGLLPLLPSRKETIFYAEGLVDIAESVWLNEK